MLEDSPSRSRPATAEERELINVGLFVFILFLVSSVLCASVSGFHMRACAMSRQDTQPVEDGSITGTESEDSLQPVADADEAKNGEPEPAGHPLSNDDEASSDADSDDSSLDKETLIMGEGSPNSCADLAPGLAPPPCEKKWPEGDMKEWTNVCVDYLALHDEGIKDHPMFDAYVKHCVEVFYDHGPEAAETLADIRHWHDWIFVQKRESKGVPRAPWLIELRVV